MKAADPVAELETDVAERFEAGQELAAKHLQQRLELEVRHLDRLRKLETQHQVELAELEAEQLDEVAKLWRSQGRKLGPWASGGHWKGGTNGKKR